MAVIFTIVTLALAVILHEVAHAWMANKLGDSTAKDLGRLTLNPLKHIDPVGTLLLPGVLIVLRFFGYPVIIFAWAKPVPVNFSKLRQPKRDMILVGMAGPAINVLLAVFFSLLMKLSLSSAVTELLSFAIFINLLLAIFNMIPIPPLDGSRLVMGLLPNRYAYMYSRLEPYGILIVMLLLYLDIFSKIVLPIVDHIGQWLGVSFV